MRKVSCLVLLCGTIAFAQTSGDGGTGFSSNWINKSADPCTDFYEHACGNWIKANPIPPDQSRWGRFNELDRRNLSLLRDILETSAAKKTRTGVEAKIGDYYAACMDEKAIEMKGAAPLQPTLKRIASLNDKSVLADEIVRLHRDGTQVLFAFYSRQDHTDSTRVIAQADQGGLGLPDRDYYLRTDAKSVELRNEYVAHIARMFELLGESPAGAAAKGKTVMALETALAKASMDRVSRRNPANMYHLMSVSELEKLSPSFNWKRYLATIGAPPLKELNVVAPEFFKQLEETLRTQPLDDIKVYLTFHAAKSAAPFLPSNFVNANFEFFGKTLTGAQELKPRWRRCVEYTDSDLGEALGQKFVEQAFSGRSKERMLEMVKNLVHALEKDIQQLDWMTPATKTRAIEKLRTVSEKIGYPDKWKDYTALKLDAKDALGNSERANHFEFSRRLNKIGKPVDKQEWLMTPPTVNAYYTPQQNTINFPAGILQPPFFDARMDDAVNYGGIGAVIGHELTHGFDDNGRKFDANGNMADWWTTADAHEFENRAECIVQQYGSYVAVADVKLNGKLTLGENVADNGGLRIAYMALMDALTGKTTQRIDGYSPEQRFFLGWGQVWCSNQTPESARLRAQTDPHSSARYRVNGTVSNMPEFRSAFGCNAGQPMVRERACRVW